MKPVISIGNQDFSSIRENNSFYIDKTSFIKEWWGNRDVVTLITRPRRFGKTLNMSMTEAFFSNQYAGRKDLFEGLSVWNDPEYREMQGSFPTIFLSFADIKASTYKVARSAIIQKLIRLYNMYDYLKTDNVLRGADWDYIRSIKTDMTDEIAAVSLNYLCEYLYRYSGKKVLIFLDEYDTPLQEAFVNGYWEELSEFMRSLFNSTFKTNPYMERGLLTGITRVGKESIFSDLNNIEVVTTTSVKYQTSFGFTEEEVQFALKEFELSDSMEKVRLWYDGFRFGSRKDIYNPWSITKYLDSGKFDSYWANTSSNSLISKLIREGTPDIKIAMEDLLKGRQMESVIDEEIVYSQLNQNTAAIWSLLLASGYLKVEKAPMEGSGGIYVLSLTNYEVEKMFRRMIHEWFQNTSVRYNDFVKALLDEDVDYMNEFMNQIALQTFSSFDAGKKPSEKAEPEKFYHGFLLGLIVDLADKYRIMSNRESGLGRYDVVLEPLKDGLNAYVFEFKVRRPQKEKNLEETVQNALKQIADKGYDTELIARGIPGEKIRHYGFAFEGKKVLIGC
ncbi:AAA family ATPase [Blautia sp. HCP3S3_G3]|uniref:AAA family ATPase n=1 Tax=Blautia sp. HCP3S3_G3 TaxID=3438913 RepID=UPI003F8B9A03